VLHDGAIAVDDSAVQSSVAFGPERTLEQDPMFAFRIIVDIALKALSPAINDPTTAVLALDQMHRLLRMVGQRKLRGEVIVDGSGRPRVMFRTPNWEHLRSSRLQRDSCLRRGQSPSRAPHAGDARKPPQDAAGTPPRYNTSTSAAGARPCSDRKQATAACSARMERCLARPSSRSVPGPHCCSPN